MDQPLPEWLCNDFFTQCLQKEKETLDITVTNFTTSPAAPPGNSYGSFVIRVKVEYKEGQDNPELHSLSLIIKSELTHGPIKDFSTEFQLIEPSFYYSFIPELSKFIDTRFFPKSLFSPRPNVTVLEDLSEHGFVMVERTKQLDFNHCRLYMIAAATLHAVSVAVYKVSPELLEPIKNINFFSSDSKIFQISTKCSMMCLAEETEKIERFKKYSGIIREAIPQVLAFMDEPDKSPSDIINTIRQGDPWSSNMMFKYDEEGNVYDIKLIDFQFTSYGSPINDLMFFIWTSANNDVLKHKLEELYKIYIDTFNEKLVQLNCTERLTYQQVESEMKRLTPMVFFAIGELPSILNPEAEDIEEIFSSDDVVEIENSFKKSYNEDYCKNHLPHLLESLELNRVFDYFEKRKQ